MVTEHVKELAAVKAKVASLEAQISAELAELPAMYGFADARSFISAVYASTGARRGPRKALKRGTARGRRTRATITDATRQEVQRLVKSGKTGSEIAKAVGISLPSVQNIKKALGLVRSRK